MAGDGWAAVIGRFLDPLFTVGSPERKRASEEIQEIIGRCVAVSARPRKIDSHEGVLVVFSPFYHAGCDHEDDEHYPTGHDHPEIRGQNYDIEFIYNLLLAWSHRNRLYADEAIGREVTQFHTYLEGFIDEEHRTGLLSYSFLSVKEYGEVYGKSKAAGELSSFAAFRDEFHARWNSFATAVYQVLEGRRHRWEVVNSIGAVVSLGFTACLLIWNLWLKPQRNFLAGSEPSLFWPVAAGIALFFAWFHEAEIQQSIRGTRTLLLLGTLLWVAYSLLR